MVGIISFSTLNSGCLNNKPHKSQSLHSDTGMRFGIFLRVALVYSLIATQTMKIFDTSFCRLLTPLLVRDSVELQYVRAVSCCHRGNSTEDNFVRVLLIAVENLVVATELTLNLIVRSEIDFSFIAILY